ncbi:hypothetical protein BOX15_Mlig019643g4, partial [Macrostomum lignano]
ELEKQIMAGRGAWKSASPSSSNGLIPSPPVPHHPASQPVALGIETNAAINTGFNGGRAGATVSNGAVASPPTGLNSTTGFGASIGFGGSGGGGGGGDSSGRRQGCFRCNETGHIARDCPNQPSGGGGRGGGGGDGACYRCKETGHIARDCPNASAEVCYKCNQPGHIARDCPTRVGADDAAAGDPIVRETYIPTELTVEAIARMSVKTGVNALIFDQIEVELTGSNKPPPIKTLQEIGVPDSVLKVVTDSFKINRLFPVQAYAIPIVASGRDLLACAQTGSGKTLAYLLPIIKMLLDTLSTDNTVFNGVCYPTSLIVVPTRELATQVYDQCTVYFKPVGLKVQRIHGSIQHAHLVKCLQSGAHTLVATVGRLKDFINRNLVSLARTKLIVLDEADRMLEQGFQEDVVAFMQSADQRRQVIMFSATYPHSVQTLAGSYLAQDYLFLSIGRVGKPSPDVTQEVREVSQGDKVATLLALLAEFRDLEPNGFGERKVLVFVERKETANLIGMLLCDKGFEATNNHGDRPPAERQRAFSEFRSGTTPVMVTTNMMSRGIDISGISLVINYDLPQDDSSYVHRIGRTGRCGNLGRSISFFDPNADGPLAHQLVGNLRSAQQPVPEWLETIAEREGCSGNGYGGRGRGRGEYRDIRRGIGRTVEIIDDSFGLGDGGGAFQPRPADVPNEDDWS